VTIASGASDRAMKDESQAADVTSGGGLTLRGAATTARTFSRPGSPPPSSTASP